ncbi:MAG: hypothetical protein ABI361_09205 [Nitrososphaera sp.]
MADSYRKYDQSDLTNPIAELDATCCDGTGTHYSARLLPTTQHQWQYVWGAKLECGEFSSSTPGLDENSDPTAFWYHPTPAECTTETHTGNVTLTAIFTVPTNIRHVFDQYAYVCTDSAGSPAATVYAYQCSFERHFDTAPIMGESLVFSSSHVVISNPPQNLTAVLYSKFLPSQIANGMAVLSSPSLPDFSKWNGTVYWQTDAQDAVSPITGQHYPSTSVTDLNFNVTTRTLTLGINGTSGKHGFINVVIPKQLLTGPFNATLDGKTFPIITTPENNDTIVTAPELHYSSHILTITGATSPTFDNAIASLNSGSVSAGATPTPEFPLPALALVGAIAVVIVVARRKLRLIG